MILNGIDYTARSAALAAINVDPHGPMSQYQTALDTHYVFCRQHHGVHRTDASCTVHAIEQFPLTTTGDFEDAFTECRERGFRLYGEARPCAACGADISLGHNGWATVTDGDRACPNARPSMHGNAHQPVSSIPETATTTV
jgi:hypothetical protein